MFPPLRHHNARSPYRLLIVSRIKDQRPAYHGLLADEIDSRYLLNLNRHIRIEDAHPLRVRVPE